MKPTAPAIAPEGGCVRLACCVPFCRRTFRNDKNQTPWPEGSEVICGKHWRLIDRDRRRRYDKLKRLFKNKRGTLQGKLADYIHERLGREWERLKTVAIEAAAGIG